MEVADMAVSNGAEFDAKNRLNVLVIYEIAHLVYGPSPTDDEYNAVATEMCESSIHSDIAKLAADIRDEADRMASRRAF
jgi:hypothetical protein